MLFGSHVKAGFAALLEGVSRGSHLRSLEIEHHNASAPGSHKLTGFAALYKGGGRGGHVQSLEDGCPGHLRLILRSILQRFIGNGRSVANYILFARRVNVLPALRPFHKSLAASRAPISRRQGQGRRSTFLACGQVAAVLAATGKGGKVRDTFQALGPIHAEL